MRSKTPPLRLPGLKRFTSGILPVRRLLDRIILPPMLVWLQACRQVSPAPVLKTLAPRVVQHFFMPGRPSPAELMTWFWWEGSKR